MRSVYISMCVVIAAYALGRPHIAYAQESDEGEDAEQVVKAEAEHERRIDRETHDQFLDLIGAKKIVITLSPTLISSPSSRKGGRNIHYRFFEAMQTTDENCWLAALQVLDSWYRRASPVDNPSEFLRHHPIRTPWTELDADEDEAEGLPSRGPEWETFLAGALDGIGLKELTIPGDKDIYRALVAHGPLIYGSRKKHHVYVVVGATWIDSVWYAHLYDVGSGELFAVRADRLREKELGPIFLAGGRSLDGDERVQEAFGETVAIPVGDLE